MILPILFCPSSSIFGIFYLLSSHSYTRHRAKTHTTLRKKASQWMAPSIRRQGADWSSEDKFWLQASQGTLSHGCKWIDPPVLPTCNSGWICIYQDNYLRLRITLERGTPLWSVTINSMNLRSHFGLAPGIVASFSLPAEWRLKAWGAGFVVNDESMSQSENESMSRK